MSIGTPAANLACGHLTQSHYKTFPGDCSRCPNKLRREKWWQFERHAKELYKSLDGLSSCLATLEVAKYLVFVWQPTDIVFASTCIVVATDLDLAFAFLQSSVHETWARRPGLSKLENRPRYNPKKCYQTFPIPRKQGELLEEDKELSNLANKYYIHRQSIAVNCSVGQTEIYNRFHNPTQADPDIQTLRDLHIQMDTAVAAAYGWHDLLPSTSGRGRVVSYWRRKMRMD